MLFRHRNLLEDLHQKANILIIMQHLHSVRTIQGVLQLYNRAGLNHNQTDLTTGTNQIMYPSHNVRQNLHATFTSLNHM